MSSLLPSTSPYRFPHHQGRRVFAPETSGKTVLFFLETKSANPVFLRKSLKEGEGERADTIWQNTTEKNRPHTLLSFFYLCSCHVSKCPSFSGSEAVVGQTYVVSCFFLFMGCVIVCMCCGSGSSGWLDQESKECRDCLWAWRFFFFCRGLFVGLV